MTDRDLDWAGCLNARDLGGLATAAGGRTRWGSIVRSDNPAYLTSPGWSALHAHGVRTIVALRTVGTTDDEPDRALFPVEVTFEHVFVEDLGDPAFVERCVDSGLWCTPLYFRPMVEHWPQWCVAGVRAVAAAPPGGVLIACGRGCDRTGLLAFLLLAIAGVGADDIAEDWSRSIDRLRPREPDIETTLDAILEREGMTVLGALTTTLREVDVVERLRAAGLTDEELASVRRRLVEPPEGANAAPASSTPAP